MEQLPRQDSAHLSNLSQLYNTTLHQLVAASHLNQRLVVVGHPSLSTTSEAETLAMFGSRSSPRSDGIHFRGSEGARWHTDSVIAALKSAGLAEWRSQGRRGAASLHPSGSYGQAVETANMFQPLNY